MPCAAANGSTCGSRTTSPGRRRGVGSVTGATGATGGVGMQRGREGGAGRRDAGRRALAGKLQGRHHAVQCRLTRPFMPGTHNAPARVAAAPPSPAPPLPAALELRHLRAFLAVSDGASGSGATDGRAPGEVHVGRAAARLHVTQPALTRQLQQLERVLGLRLFTRAGRRLALTPAGEAFRAAAGTAVGGLTAAVETARRVARGEVGRLAVAFEGSVADDLVPQAVRAFRGRYPGVAVGLDDCPTAAQLERLRAGALDVGFAVTGGDEDASAGAGGAGPADGAVDRAWADGAPVWEGISTTLLRRIPLALLLPRGHPLARLRTVPVAALAGQPLVVVRHPAACGVTGPLLALARAARLELVQEVGDLQALTGLVAAGLGLALVPAAPTWRRSGVVTRPLGPGAVGVGLVLAWRRDDGSATVAAFRAIVAEQRALRGVAAAARPT
jgi:DNA-binding transcriptional LysR family regulator